MNSKSWDSYYHSICVIVGSHSKCLSRQIGAILVKDKVIICTGFNGPPRGVPHCEPINTVDGQLLCKRRNIYPSGGGLHLCPGAHAERNAIVQAARLGIQTKDATLYLNTNIPCKDCIIEIINAGIPEVVCTELTYYDKLSRWLIRESGLTIRLFDFIKREPLPPADSINNKTT